ncbi:uncharacterized protein LOC128141259 [Harpia harpyja]|uniref:uncharacterized protein LOC128141259 n=1 Tax=Harpia harpyja TaxID=202280 RepID=UPI0022B0AD67|nr:uncharacterized protein LOC128141259 [Harpia harpyja]
MPPLQHGSGICRGSGVPVAAPETRPIRGNGGVALKAKDAAAPQEYQTLKGWALSQLQTGSRITISTPRNWAAVWVGRSRGKATLPQADGASREPCSTLLRPCEAEASSDRLCLSLYFPPACCKAALSAPASSLHPEQSEPCSGWEGRTQRLSRRGWRAKRRLSAEHPLSTPWGGRQPLPHQLLAHHAGYFHPDVFCHHRPGDPLLHHLHALERCWGRCGSASASQSKHRPAAAWSVSLGAFWKSVNPLRATGCPTRSKEPRGLGAGVAEGAEQERPSEAKEGNGVAGERAAR